MRIAVIVPAYRRPLSLLTLLGSLHALSSGENAIEYHIGIDSDDFDVTRVTGQQLLGLQKIGVTSHVMPAPPTLGEKTNAIVSKVEADVYCWLADDVFPVVREWDLFIEAAITAHGLHAFCWQELGDPVNTTYPCMSRQYLAALGGKFFTEHFPHWLVDTWIAEVYLYAFGHDMRIVKNMPLAGKHTKSSGVRDLAFWFRFFTATRGERIEQAKAVRAALKLPDHDQTARMIEQHRTWDEGQLARCPEFEAAFALGGDPSPRYLVAKERAERWLDDRNTEDRCAPAS